jgi:hypothetical protein
MAETKYFDIISIDLTNKQNVLSPAPTDNKDLEEFYNSNENSFIGPEHRSFDYITIGKDFFSKKIDVQEAEIKAYYDANKNEFDNKPYSSVKKEIQSILYNAKLEDLIAGFSKNLEEEVAAGLTLKDLATKHSIKISSIADISKDTLLADDNLKLSEIADSVFEMLEAEVSYPMEIMNQNKIVLVELKAITPPRKQEFVEVKDQIASILREKTIAIENIKILQEAQQEYIAQKGNLESFKNKGVIIKNNKSIARADFQREEKINPELIHLILKTEKGNVTSLVRDDKNAYFAFIKDDKVNEAKAKKIADTSSAQITSTIKESVMQELIGYLAEQNDVKVKM